MLRAWAVKDNKGREVICQCHCKPFDYLETVLDNERHGFVPKGLYSSKDMVEYQGGWCNIYSSGYYSVPKLDGVVVPDGTFKKLGIDYQGEPVEIV